MCPGCLVRAGWRGPTSMYLLAEPCEPTRGARRPTSVARPIRVGSRGAPTVGAAAQEAHVATVATTGSVRDDRVLGVTRALAVLVAPVLLAAFVLLFGFPGRTDQLWAWTIRPTMTAMLMGSGYLSGVLYFVGVYRARSWRSVGVMFLPITVFVVFMALATLLHWDRFAHAHPSAWAWIALYAVTPVVLPWVWWRNRRHDPGARPGEARFAPGLRLAFGLLGALGLIAVVVAFVRPALLIEVWPWTLTPLTARVVLGWYALPAALFVGLAVDGRLEAVQLTLRSAVLGIAFVLASTARAWGEFDPGTPARWLFVGFFVLLLVAFVAILRRSGGAGSASTV